MKFKLVKFFILNLLLTSYTSSLKLPQPSPTVLIVNHLNYLRYDYVSNPTLRANGYPFYSGLSQLNNHLNRTDGYNRYSLNRTTDNLDLILNGHLDETLSERATIVRPNEDLNNLNDHHIEPENNHQADLSNDQIDQLANRLNEQLTGRSNDQTNEQLIERLNSLQFDGDDQQSDQNERSDQQLNRATSVVDLNNNDLSNLIVTNSAEGQQRLLELNLLQQNEPSLSLILDADSPFLNTIQDSDVPSKSKDNNSSEILRQPTNDTTLNDLYTENDAAYIEDNLDDLLNSPNFNLIDYTKSDDEQNLNSLPDSISLDSDIFLPANIDELANDLISFDNVNFLDSTLTNSDENLQSLIGGGDLSSVLNRDPCINNEPYCERSDNQVVNSSNGIRTTTITNEIDSDNYIHELLSDEDLQMIGFPNLQPPCLDDLAEASGVNDLNDNLDSTNEDRIEVSSDSAISSMSRSDWFDSCSDSSSHFDEQFSSQRDRCLKNDQHTACTSNNSNDALFDGFELTDSNYDLYSRDDVFNDPILNLDDTASRLNAIDFNGLDSVTNPNSALQTVLHNHTYTNAVEINDSDSQEASSSAAGNKAQSKSSSSNRPQTTRTNRAISHSSDSLETIRNRRLLETSHNFDMISLTSETSSAEEIEHSLSRDGKKAKELQIPISVCDIINMPIDEFNECLTKYELNEAQLTLIKDIRRRGKNKVAAQNCRKRKINQIAGLQDEVDQLQQQKDDLMSYYDKLFQIKALAKNKYQKLYDFIAERSQTNAALLANFEMNFRLANAKRNNSDEGAVGGLNETTFDENNTNQLNEMRSTGDLMLKNLTMDIKPKVNYKKALAMN